MSNALNREQKHDIYTRELAMSFEKDSLSDAEFQNAAEKKVDYTMAPTTTIETITITRPLKVIAFICGIIVIILMLMALTSTDWLMAESWRQGLFVHCIDEDYTPPLPFNLQDPPGCYASRDVTYIRATAALCIITLISDAIATVLTGLGLRTQDHNSKYKFYRFAVLVMMIAFISLLVALILYPVCFAAELNLVVQYWMMIKKNHYF
uniref:CSON001492 protein n=1 Tax=Culicoides sonorensis TaxID=179676 RepID=A0A336MHU7_CULSO